MFTTEKIVTDDSGVWCLFESNYFDNYLKKWIPKTDSIRRCLHSKCDRRHKIKNRPTKVCEREFDCPNAGITCFLLHDNTAIKPLCYFDDKCCDLNCTANRHSAGRTTEVCPDGEKCENALITCFKLHPLNKIQSVCRYKANCKNYICEKRHPSSRPELCEYAGMCYNYIVNGAEGCSLIHPKITQKLCRWDVGGNCRSFGCTYVHHPNSPTDCPDGMCCQKRISSTDICPHKHPKYTIVRELDDGSLYFE